MKTKKLPSIAGTDGSEGMMERGRFPVKPGMTVGSVSFQHIIHNPLNVQRDNGTAACVGLQEEAVVGVVVEKILRQGCTTEGILQDVEVAFPIGISVGVVLPKLVPGKSMPAASIPAGKRRR